jgi:glucokinase
MKTADHAGLAGAWHAFARDTGRPLPRRAAIAVACPVGTGVLKLTNNPWTIQPGLLPAELGVERYVLVNDFGAVGHAVAQLGPEHLAYVAGPGGDLPEEGIISVIGPGTGLGVAQVVRRGGRCLIVECEGSHTGFAPLDEVDDLLLRRLRRRFGRVSAERVVSGAGLLALYETLAEMEGRSVAPMDDKAMWDLAVSGRDPLAEAALERFCMSFGAVAGDMALAHGASAVVLAGGLGLRVADRLGASGFARCFVAKGRMEGLMRSIPVRLISHPQPGLYGAAAAFGG